MADRDIDELLLGLERSMNKGNAAKAAAQTKEPDTPKVVDMKTPFKWYHGKLGRGETEELLNNKPLGAFLVRDSTSSPGDYVLSVVEGKVSHYIINDMKGMYKIGDIKCQDVPSIIEHYKKNRLDKTTLTLSVDYGVLAALKAQFDFNSGDREDLPFKKGDTLYLIEKYDDAWWRAQDENGRTGMVPANYVKIVPVMAPTPTLPPSPARPVPRSHSQSFGSGSGSSPSSPRLERSASVVPGMASAPSPAAVAALRALADGGGGGGGALLRSHSIVSFPKVEIPDAAKRPMLPLPSDAPPEFPPMSPLSSSYPIMPDGSAILARVRVSSNIAPSSDQKDGLACSVGDTIFVLRQDAGGLWYGQNDTTGIRGYFPSIAVEVLPMPQRRATHHIAPEGF